MLAAQTLGVFLFLVWLYSAWCYYPGPIRLSLPKVFDDKRQVGWICLLSAVTLFIIDAGRGRVTFLSNIALSLATIAVTVLLLDSLAEQRDRENYRRAIIDQLGSNVNDAALEALRIVRKEQNQWHLDGSLSNESFEGANLTGADLNDAILERSYLSRAQLRGAMLNGACLNHASVHLADLRETQMYGTKLRHANLSGARLSGVQLYNVDFSHAWLMKVDLRGINFRYTKLLGAQLGGSVYDDTTQWPPDFKPESRGAVHITHRRVCKNRICDANTT